MKNVNNSEKVQGSTGNVCNGNCRGECFSAAEKAAIASFKPSEAELEAADRIVNQLAGIIARVKGRA